MSIISEPFLIREGSSLRTQDELDILFITDVRDLAACYGNEEQQAEAVQLLYDATLAFNDQCACCTAEDLEWMAHDAEDLLVALGFSVEFNDGYIITEQEG